MSNTTHVPVRDVMTPGPKTINGLATIREAVQTMRDQDVNSLIIDRRHEHDEYGVVTISDIAEKVVTPRRSYDRTNVYEVMSKPVMTVHGDMHIRYAIRLLSRFGLSRALVADKTGPIGIIKLRDMVHRMVLDTADGGEESQT